jgi:hypothetical protein
VIALVAVLISLVGVEIYLRLYAPQAIYAIRYCYLGWCHVPSVSFVHGGEAGEFITHIQYNSQGLRDYEYSIDKPVGYRRILIFGDSYTEGLEVEMEDLVAKRLERILSRCIPDHPVQVINFGVSAYDTAQEWWYFKNEGVKYQPDLVVVIWTGEAGSPFAKTRDRKPVFVEASYSRSQVWSRNVKTFLKLHFHTVSFLFDRLRANRSLREFQQKLVGRPFRLNQYGISSDGSPSLPFSKEWETQLAIFKDFLWTAQTYGAGLIVATPSAHGSRYLEQSLELHPIPGLIVVDLQEVSDEKEKQYHFPKDSHWNPRGHKKAARILFSQILRRNLLDISQGQPSIHDLQPQCLPS